MGGMAHEQDILAYVKGCRETFSTRPFCDADALALSALCYYHFENAPAVMEGPSPVRIGELYDAAERGAYLERVVDDDGSPELLDALVESPRFGPLALEHPSWFFSEELTAQFAALTFSLPAEGEGERLLVVYRGTDVDLVGWNEDFDLCIAEDVPAELFALTYFEQVLALHPGARFVLTGHSKGGTLAEYVLLNAREPDWERIESVVVFDAPGPFHLGSEACPEFLEADARVAERCEERETAFRKYLHPSMLGLLLEKRPVEGMLLVEPSREGAGHEVFAPRIVDGAIRAAPCTPEQAEQTLSLDRWAESLSLAEREAFIDGVFHRYGSREGAPLYRGAADNQAVMAWAVRGFLRLPPREKRLFANAVAKAPAL